MKKVLVLFLTLVLCISSFGMVSASEDKIGIDIYGKEVTFDVMPVNINGRVLVPLRGIFETLGAKVAWDDATKTVLASRNGTNIKLTIDSKTAYINDKEITLDVAPGIMNSRTMVPARFVAESLGCEVGWDADTKTVLIKFEGTVNETKTEEPKKEESSSTEITYPCVLLSSVNMKDMVYVAVAGTVTSKEGLIEANVTSETTTETDVYAYFKETLNGRAATGDVCLLTFKARLLSGGKDGKGIAKVQVQGDKTNNYKKALFQEVTFGSDWTDISLPFTHKEDCNTVGIRFALAVQKVEIKDVNLVNYGNAKTVAELTKKVN